MADPRLPRPGQVVRLGREASVQFAAGLTLRVIRVHDWSTYDGWVWLDGYQLDTKGLAVERRSVFVQVAGIRPADTPRIPRARNAGPGEKRTTPTTTRSSR